MPHIPSWVWPRPGVRNSICISPMGGRDTGVWPINCCLPGCKSVGNWESKPRGELETHPTSNLYYLFTALLFSTVRRSLPVRAPSACSEIFLGEVKAAEPVPGSQAACTFSKHLLSRLSVGTMGKENWSCRGAAILDSSWWQLADT